MTKFYSTNDEDFIYHDVGDVLDALAADGELEAGRIYFEGDFTRIAHSYVLNAAEILERADEILFEEVGETADEQFTSATQASKDELQALLVAWAEKWIGPVNGFMVVGKTRERRVTEEDVKEYAQ
ncbi:MAG: hypothetical protein NVV68_06980 [Dokdonella sp.]|nr:hypothetical protein [Dokdonella sp.]